MSRHRGSEKLRSITAPCYACRNSPPGEAVPKQKDLQDKPPSPAVWPAGGWCSRAPASSICQALGWEQGRARYSLGSTGEEHWDCEQLPDIPTCRQAQLTRAQATQLTQGGQGTAHCDIPQDPARVSAGSPQGELTSREEPECSPPGNGSPERAGAAGGQNKSTGFIFSRIFAQCHSCLTRLTDIGPVGQQLVDQGVPLGLLAGGGASTASSAPQNQRTTAGRTRVGRERA